MSKFEYSGSYVKECPKHGYEAHIVMVDKDNKENKLTYCLACGRPESEESK